MTMYPVPGGGQSHYPVSEQATCHPTRRRHAPDGRCRACVLDESFVRAIEDEADPLHGLPYAVRGVAQHAGPAIPETCVKCGAPWTLVGADEAECRLCGVIFYRTCGQAVSRGRAVTATREPPIGIRGRRWSRAARGG